MESKFNHSSHEPEVKRHGAGRVTVFFLTLVIINVLLGIYTLYMLGFALAYDWTQLKTGSVQAILEAALQLLLLFSPVILTLIINRLLFRAFRGHGRFPRGVWFFAILAIIAVQAATMYGILSFGFVDGINGFSVDSLAELRFPAN
jgi:magnesium-transporting ATPase (P-type)